MSKPGFDNLCKVRLCTLCYNLRISHIGSRTACVARVSQTLWHSVWL